MMGIGELIFEKLNVSLRPFPQISNKDNWMKELGAEVAGGGEDTQQTQPKTKNPIIKHGETCFGRAMCLVRVLKTSTNVCCLIAKAQMQEHRDLLTVVKTWTQIMFELGDPLKVNNPSVCVRVFAVVKQEECFRVRELVKKIESRRHREALQPICSRTASTFH